MRWLCWIGLHKWKRSGQGETMTYRCERCGKERDPYTFGGFGGGP